jgi:Dolichyl-phosphate-mannose-protein mannosyltransferase
MTSDRDSSGTRSPAVNRSETVALGLTPVVVVTLLIVLAAVLRFWRLGDWNFQATELFTLRDSSGPQFGNARPLGYVLTYYLVRPFLPIDEFGLRLLPALFGVLAIPVLFLVSQRLIGTRAALFAALLLTVSPLHVMYSQLARYWSLVFLLSAVYPYAIYLGVRDRNGRALALGLGTAVLAVLAHPVSVLLLGGPTLLLAAQLRREQLTRLWSNPYARWIVVGLVVLAAAIAVRFLPLLQGWISMHDSNPAGGQFLVRPKAPPGVKQVLYLSGFVESLTVPLVLGAIAGIYVLWRERDRSTALFLASVAGFHVGFLALLLLRTSASFYYLSPAVPVFFMGAGLFLDRLFQVDWKLRPSWLLPGTVAVGMVAAGFPTLISDYRDGRRYDFRGAAQWLETNLAPGDVVFSDQPMVLAHYLPGVQVQHLRLNPATLEQSVLHLRQSGRGEALWTVAPAPSHALRTNLRQGGLAGWLYQHCQLRHSLGTGRVDFRQQYLHIYRCPPSAQEALPAGALADHPDSISTGTGPPRGNNQR